MTRRLVVLPEAKQDIREAMRWYKRQRRGLGAEFVGVVDAGLAQLFANPLAFATWPDDERYRRFVLHRFPYLVFYELRPDAVEVVAVAHASREPGFWTSRIKPAGAADDEPE